MRQTYKTKDGKIKLEFDPTLRYKLKYSKKAFKKMTQGDALVLHELVNQPNFKIAMKHMKTQEAMQYFMKFNATGLMRDPEFSYVVARICKHFYKKNSNDSIFKK